MPRQSANKKAGAKPAAAGPDRNAISAYLEALAANKPKRGRKRDPQTMQRQLSELDSRIKSATPLRRLGLVQKRRELQEQMKQTQSGVDLKDLQAKFVKSAKQYGDKRGISYGTWREMGVPAEVLKEAGISR